MTGNKSSKPKTRKGTNEIQYEDQTFEKECKAISMVEFPEKNRNCSLCEYSIFNKQSLKHHLLTVHTTIKVLECMKCVPTKR